MMLQRQLPTVSEVQAAALEGKFTNAQILAAANKSDSGDEHRSRRIITLESVPSHIVPPRKKD